MDSSVVLELLREIEFLGTSALCKVVNVHSSPTCSILLCSSSSANSYLAGGGLQRTFLLS